MSRGPTLWVALGAMGCTGTAGLADAPVSVSIDAGVGLRDLHAVVDGPARSVTWRSDDGDEVDGPVVRADRLWPGQSWTVVVRGATGDVASDTLTVPEPPGGNVLVVLLDDVGVDKVSAYGDPTAPPTPTLDGLADAGVRFTRAYTSPVCSPTRGVLLTGRHARRIGIGWVVDSGNLDRALSLDAYTLPEALRDARSTDPWSDGAVGKWHLAGPEFADALTHPTDSGFSWFSGTLGNPDATDGYDRWEHVEDGVVSERTGYLTTAAVDDALDRIEQMPEPWLLYLAPQAAHWPWTAPPDDLLPEPADPDATGEPAYNAVLQAFDHELGRLLDTLGPERLARTTVIVVGDNGTPYEAVNAIHDSDRQKATLFEGGVHVPLLVTGPHVAAPGSVSDGLVHVADVFPTVAQIAGVPLVGPDDALAVSVEGSLRPLDGRSLLPRLSDPGGPGHTLVYAEAFTPNGEPIIGYGLNRRMVRDERYKLMRHGDLESFFDLRDRTIEDPDGPDLLDAPLAAEASEAWVRLTFELDTLQQTVVYEGR